MKTRKLELSLIVKYVLVSLILSAIMILLTNNVEIATAMGIVLGLIAIEAWKRPTERFWAYKHYKLSIRSHSPNVADYNILISIGLVCMLVNLVFTSLPLFVIGIAFIVVFGIYYLVYEMKR